MIGLGLSMAAQACGAGRHSATLLLCGAPSGVVPPRLCACGIRFRIIAQRAPLRNPVSFRFVLWL